MAEYLSKFLLARGRTPLERSCSGKPLKHDSVIWQQETTVLGLHFSRRQYGSICSHSGAIASTMWNLSEKVKGVKTGACFSELGRANFFKFGRDTALSSVRDKFVLDFR